MGLSDGKIISMIRSAVLIQSTSATDGQPIRLRTELPWHIRAIARCRASKASVPTRQLRTFHCIHFSAVLVIVNPSICRSLTLVDTGLCRHGLTHDTDFFTLYQPHEGHDSSFLAPNSVSTFHSNRTTRFKVKYTSVGKM